jgi:signal transduction histidine kinase
MEAEAVHGAGEWPRRLLAPVLGLRTWAATGYLLLTFLTGLFWFIVLITGVSLGFGLVIIWVGVPILVGMLFVVRAGARVERALLRATVGVDIPDPYRKAPAGSIWARLRSAAGDPATWKDLVYLLLLFPLGTLWFALVTFVWSVPIGLVTMPLWYRLPPGGHAQLFTIDGNPLVVVDSLGKALVAMLVGLVLALAVPAVIRGFTLAQTSLARGLLGPSSAELVERVATLEDSRARTVEAAASERRRIERDLHDGAQQRLVALAMDLGMAREKFSSDPDAARALVEEAHQEAKRAIAELRDLARGIHPAVLTDRGLDAALSALAARSPVPVEVRVDLPDRLAEPLEVIAYFIVAEALTNVARHAAATRASVDVAVRDGRLVVEVGDDGTGGADPALGSGLAGLADRVAGVDGRLTVTSPPGGPTTVRAELPALPR